MGAEEFGLEVTMHAHAAGFVEFEDELEDVLDAIEPGCSASVSIPATASTPASIPWHFTGGTASG
jgi:hypothetical protein